MDSSWYFLLALCIGAGVGLSELLSRYSWSVWAIVSSRAGWSYLAINGLAAVLAYKAAIDWKLVVLAGKPEGWRVLLVSVMAMAVLRSAFATIRTGDKEVGVGLVSFIDVFLRRTERVLDQAITDKRLTRIVEVVSGLTYDATQQYFVSITESVLLSLTDEEKAALQREVLKIDGMDLDSDAKLLLLAVCLENRIGEDLLASIAKTAEKRFAVQIADERATRERNLKRLAELKLSI